MVSLSSIHTNDKSYLNIKTNILFLGLFKGAKLNTEQNNLDKYLNNCISKAIKVDGFSGKKDEVIHVFGNEIHKRIVFFGLGDKSKFSSDKLRSIASNVFKFASNLKLKTIYIDGESFNLQKNNYAQSFAEGLVLGSYEFNDYKTVNDGRAIVDSITISGSVDSRSIDKGFILGKSVGFARDLGNHPANIMTPSYLAKYAKEISEKSDAMSCKIFDGKEFIKMGMGAFHGVAMGATEPAKMIIVEYNGGNSGDKPVALVGKGLTFDSGGISLKPSLNMDEMKFDMCGSATVMGVLKAVSELKPKINILFAIGSTENMPGSNAQRPGDIVTAYNGKTIEVLNTDAEGRLVLADVLSYINKNYKPSAILDFATLTGAVLIALGNRASAVLGNNDELMSEIKNASDITSEKVWELPLWPEYTKEIKGKYADIKNIGEGRLAGTITAAAFLKEFVDNTPWIHMDIAGTAWGPKEPAYQPKIGATGVAVRLVYQFLENRL